MAQTREVTSQQGHNMHEVREGGPSGGATSRSIEMLPLPLVRTERGWGGG